MLTIEWPHGRYDVQDWQCYLQVELRSCNGNKEMHDGEEEPFQVLYGPVGSQERYCYHCMRDILTEAWTQVQGGG
jgi:hypothetical protein